MCLCGSCHQSNISGSFHNIYGTHETTPEDLEEYINTKRIQLGIDKSFSLESYFNGEILRKDNI